MGIRNRKKESDDLTFRTKLFTFENISAIKDLTLKTYMELVKIPVQERTLPSDQEVVTSLEKAQPLIEEARSALHEYFKIPEAKIPDMKFFLGSGYVPPSSLEKFGWQGIEAKVKNYYFTGRDTLRMHPYYFTAAASVHTSLNYLVTKKFKPLHTIIGMVGNMALMTKAYAGTEGTQLSDKVYVRQNFESYFQLVFAHEYTHLLQSAQMKNQGFFRKIHHSCSATEGFAESAGIMIAPKMSINYRYEATFEKGRRLLTAFTIIANTLTKKSKLPRINPYAEGTTLFFLAMEKFGDEVLHRALYGDYDLLKEV